MIYDYSEGFENAKVMVADTGRLTTSSDKRFLMLDMINGESFENLNKKQQKATGSTKSIPYRRETFTHKRIIIDFATDFNRYDESILEDQHVSKNVAQLVHSIDSVQEVSRQRSTEQSSKLLNERYFGRETANAPIILPQTLTIEERKIYNLDSLWAKLDVGAYRRVLSTAQEKAR